jgi:hypothetical protein
MASYNQQQRGQHGLNNGHGGGECNNDAAAANQQEKQEQVFVRPSLCIPRTHANIRRERIFAVIRSLGLGWVGRIDVVEKMDEKGTPFIRVFIHFTKWFQNAQTRQFLEHLETQKSANIVYDEPWFWKVTKSYVPAPTPQQQQQQQQQQPSRFPKPRIDFAGASTRVQQEGQEQEQQEQVAATVSSKTPSSNASGTNAVSGKGKQVAKRMGYESGKGLGKKADGRLVPVQIKKNVGRNGLGLGSAVVDVADAVAVVDVADAIALAVADDTVVDTTTSSDYWTTHAHDGYTQAQLLTFAKCAFPRALEQAAAAVEPRLSVSVSPPTKLERRLFHNDCCDDDCVASVYNMNKSNSA